MLFKKFKSLIYCITKSPWNQPGAGRYARVLQKDGGGEKQFQTCLQVQLILVVVKFRDQLLNTVSITSCCLEGPREKRPSREQNKTENRSWDWADRAVREPSENSYCCGYAQIIVFGREHGRKRLRISREKNGSGLLRQICG